MLNWLTWLFTYRNLEKKLRHTLKTQLEPGKNGMPVRVHECTTASTCLVCRLYGPQSFAHCVCLSLNWFTIEFLSNLFLLLKPSPGYQRLFLSDKCLTNLCSRFCLVPFVESAYLIHTFLRKNNIENIIWFFFVSCYFIFLLQFLI